MTMTEYYEKYEKLQVEPPELTPALGNTSVKNLLVLKHKRRVSQLKLFNPKLNKKTKKKKKAYFQHLLYVSVIANVFKLPSSILGYSMHIN